MTMTAPRAALSARELADLRRRMCGKKRGYSAHHAQEVAARMRSKNDPVIAYPCPFHPDRDAEYGSRTWHVGHTPSVERIRLLARYLRFGGPA